MLQPNDSNSAYMLQRTDNHASEKKVCDENVEISLPADVHIQGHAEMFALSATMLSSSDSHASSNKSKT